MHAVINAKTGVPSTNEQRNIHEAVITYHELRFLLSPILTKTITSSIEAALFFAIFGAHSPQCFLSYLAQSKLKSERYITLITDLRATPQNWRRSETKDLMVAIADYVLGESPSPSFVADCLSLLNDLQWEGLLKAMGVQPVLTGAELGQAMDNSHSGGGTQRRKCNSSVLLGISKRLGARCPGF